jgi:hypothetical protein
MLLFGASMIVQTPLLPTMTQQHRPMMEVAFITAMQLVLHHTLISAKMRLQLPTQLGIVRKNL